MKKTIMLFFWLTAVGHGVLAGGARNFKGDPQVRIIQTGEIVKVVYLNTDATPVRISFLDAQGDKVFSEKIVRRDSFIRPYNLSNLEEGIYQIQVEHKDGRFTGQIAFVHPVDNKEIVAHLASVLKPDRKKRFLLSIPDQGFHELDIAIFDERENILFHNTFDVSGDFARVFRIEDHQGDIKVQVRHKDGYVRQLRYRDD